MEKLSHSNSQHNSVQIEQFVVDAPKLGNSRPNEQRQQYKKRRTKEIKQVRDRSGTCVLIDWWGEFLLRVPGGTIHPQLKLH